MILVTFKVIEDSKKYYSIKKSKENICSRILKTKLKFFVYCCFCCSWKQNKNFFVYFFYRATELLSTCRWSLSWSWPCWRAQESERSIPSFSEDTGERSIYIRHWFTERIWKSARSKIFVNDVTCNEPFRLLRTRLKKCETNKKKWDLKVPKITTI